MKLSTVAIYSSILTLFHHKAQAMVAFSPKQTFKHSPTFNIMPSKVSHTTNDYFHVVEPSSKRGATVIEAPTSQHGVSLYIAIDSDSFQGVHRPGNGGIRLLNYPTTKHAIDDAVRLAKGMTRKHDMFRTGFSGAKVVVNSDTKDLTQVDRKLLMKDAARALKALDGSMYTGKKMSWKQYDPGC